LSDARVQTRENLALTAHLLQQLTLSVDVRSLPEGQYAEDEQGNR
jgi:hypothetical protein